MRILLAGAGGICMEYGVSSHHRRETAFRFPSSISQQCFYLNIFLVLVEMFF